MSTQPLFAGGWLGAFLRELALWGGVLLSVASGLSFYHGLKRRQMAELLAETPRSDVADVRPSEVVRVRGTVVPKDETDAFTSSVNADEACVLSAWAIEEKYDSGTTRSWEDAACGVVSVPFYVTDATGTLLVDVDDRTVGNETDDVFTPERLLADEGVSVAGLRCEFDSFDVRIETDYDESPPERVAEFLKSTDGVSVTPMATETLVDASKRRYREQTLRPGDEVSVVGHAQPRDESVSVAGPDDPVVTQSERVTLYLSTRPLDDVADGGGSMLFGLLTGAVGIGLLSLVFVV